MAREPWGLLVYNAEPYSTMMPLLVKQLATDLALGLVFAIALWCAALRLPGFWSRTGFVGMLGLLPFLAVHLPNRTWYGYPEAYTLAGFGENVLGALLAGSVLGVMIGRE